MGEILSGILSDLEWFVNDDGLCDLDLLIKMSPDPPSVGGFEEPTGFEVSSVIPFPG